MSRANQWFVPGDGIAREVITADIQRYLGPDALVRPGAGTGEYEGVPGYWITAYRTLTSQMIQDLKMDSTRWQQEQGRQDVGRGGSPYAPNAKVVRHPDASVVAYQDSRTHAARQHYGPSESFAQGREREPSRATHTAPQYTTSEHYTTTPTASSSYGSVRTTTYPVQQTAYATAPRTQPDPYAYAQPGREQPSYAAPAQYAGYSHTVAPEPYRQPPPPTHSYPTPSPVAAPGYYIASDGRQYPLQQQPQQPTGRSRRPG